MSSGGAEASLSRRGTQPAVSRFRDGDDSGFEGDAILDEGSGTDAIPPLRVVPDCIRNLRPARSENISGSPLWMAFSGSPVLFGEGNSADLIEHGSQAKAVEAATLVSGFLPNI